MKPILTLGYKEGPQSPQTLARHKKNLFSEKMVLAKADALLRETGQFKKWTALCQKNGDLAIETAHIILQRHELLTTAKQGKVIDWMRFDGLTQKLKTQNIHLYTSSELFSQDPGLSPVSNQHSPLAIHSLNRESSSDATPSSEIPKGPGQNSYPAENEYPPTTLPLPPLVFTPQADSPPLVLPDENLVVLSAEFDHHILNNSLVGYGNSNQLYLPLSGISATLDFNIDVDPDNQKAAGWFISEDRTFSLDLSNMTAVSRDRKMDIPPGGVIPSQGDLYIDTNLLSTWFPVDYIYDFSNQALEIKPREKLPFQQRLERLQGWQNMWEGETGGTQFPRKDSTYDMLSLPFVDFGMSGSYRAGPKTDDEFSSGFYINAKGDFAKMNGEFYLSGDDKNGLDRSRITMRRKDPDGGLLGPLNATSVEAGDIRVSTFPIIGGGEIERGVAITNEKVLHAKEYDTTYFEGNLPPGWDVEVYRNDALVASQRVGSEGRYSFNDISIYYGENDFKLIFYGPQGQQRVETKTINVGDQILKKGEGEYQLTLSQKNSKMYDVHQTGSTLDDDTFKLNGRYDYGLGSNISLGGGFSTQQASGDRHNYLNFGAKGSFDKFYLSAEYVHDTQGGDAIETLIQTKIKDTGFKLRQQLYHDLNASGDTTNPLERRTDLSVTGSLKGNEALGDIPFTLNYGESKRAHNTDRRLGARLSTDMGPVNLNNSMYWYQYEDASSLEGDFQATAHLGKLRLRGGMDYKLDPETKIKKTEFSSFYRIDEHLSTELSIEKEMDQLDATRSSLNLSWNNGKFIVSPQVSYDTNGDWTASLGFSTSLGQEPRKRTIHASSVPMADSGAVSAKVYFDKNTNAILDEGDEVIEGASVNAVQSYKDASTDQNGVAFLTGLPKYKPTDIVLDSASLEDPFWEPVKKNVSIVPRPGHVERIDIPVSITGEIDGTLLTLSKDGMEKPLPNVKIQLWDEENNLVQEVRSEYDGFYYFQKVFPGNYSVKIHPETAQNIGLTAQASLIEIDKEGSIVSGNDILLAPKKLAQTTEKSFLDEKNEARKKVSHDSLLTANEIQKHPAEGTGRKTVSQIKPILDNAYKQSAIQSASEQPLKLKSETVTPLKQESTGPIRTDPMGGRKVEPLNAVVEKQQNPLKPTPRFGLHLTSYRTLDQAAAGINYLTKKYKNILSSADFTIQKVNVSPEKGYWYRVMAGSSTDKNTITQLKNKIKMAAPYAKVLTLDTNDTNDTPRKGVHLESYRSLEKARQGIVELKKRYPGLLKQTEFTIQDVDLGPQKGQWKRVVAGNFVHAADAVTLARKIKLQSPFCKITPLEKQGEFGIHVASYRTAQKASMGIKLLEKRYGQLLDDQPFSIRKTDLGPTKGSWYRIIVGRFDNKKDASLIKKPLKTDDQYARILKFPH